VVNDRMQTGYSYYRTEPVGRNFAPQFRPQLTPKQMLELGVFGGKYMTDCRDEFPAAWFVRAKLADGRRDPRLNYFDVNASQSLAVWRRNRRIHAGGSNGIAATTWVAGLPTTGVKSGGGGRSPAMSRPSGNTASLVIASAAGDSARPCSTGHTTAESCSSRRH